MLAIHNGKPVIATDFQHYIWPRITKKVEAAVMQQLHQTLSIYNRSGIIEEFEQAFAIYHGKRYGLMSNSGTSALFSIYEGLNLQRGDEVIFPTYTFLATASPIIYTGAIPIFCDCKEDGNINPDEVEAKITAKTKAIMITHMWGIPCDMDPLLEIAQKHGIPLLEDASHAHGAKYKGRTVGSFGLASAWSLQGQKIISGGEGGIMLTDDKEIYYRATLQGHYNKRCKQEIDPKHPSYSFSLTGLGQKLRSHPLAVAIINQQFSHLEKWQAQRNKYAARFIEHFNRYPFLSMPNTEDREPSWYAFTMQYNEKLANGVPLKRFQEALHAEGLVEADRPGSTKPLHDLPLFTSPHVAMPRLYDEFIKQKGSFANAEKYCQNALKIPVWSFADEKYIVEAYIKGICKVADAIMNGDNLSVNISKR